MAIIRIIQKTKNALQSGRAGTGEWIIEFEPDQAKKADPLMGWAGSGDTRQQIALRFPTLDAAQAYAKRKGLSATVIPAAPRQLKLQAYADNFR
jgi:ETC complex I subunit conserved region